MGPAMVEGVIRGNQGKAREVLEREVSGVPWDSFPPNDPRPYSDFARCRSPCSAPIERAMAILAATGTGDSAGNPAPGWRTGPRAGGDRLQPG